MSMKAFWLGAIPALVLLTLVGPLAAPLVDPIAEPWKSIILVTAASALFAFTGWITQRILERRRGA
jgi:CDP-diglyceride synthetase